MKIGFFITARLKSKRLKKKVLRNIAGMSVLGHVIESARQVAGLENVVVCTSPVVQDRPILDVCKKHDCEYFVGSADDVLNRLLTAARLFGCDYLLLITADNPLFSFEYAQRLVSRIESDPEVDFLRIDGLPLGMDPYIVSRNAFEVVDAIKTDVDTEFWPEYLKDQSVFNHKKIAAESNHRRDYPGHAGLSLRIWPFSRQSFKACYRGRPISVSKVIEFLDASPDVRAMKRFHRTILARCAPRCANRKSPRSES